MDQTKENQSFPKIGLALGGGAARGFCHLGVLKVLQKHHIPVHCIAGCSMGAAVGGLYAAGVPLPDMEKMVEKISDYTIRDLSVSSKRQGFFKGGRVLKIIKRFLGEKTFDDCRIPFAATATDLAKAELRVFTQGPLAAAIRASISIPGVFHVAEIGGERFIDGNITERIPVSATKALGADFVIAVDAIGPIRTDYTPKGIFDIFERVMLIMDWAANKEKISAEPDYLITPDQGTRSLQKFKNNAESVKAGEDAAESAIPEILKMLR